MKRQKDALAKSFAETLEISSAVRTAAARGLPVISPEIPSRRDGAVGFNFQDKNGQLVQGSYPLSKVNVSIAM